MPGMGCRWRLLVAGVVSLLLLAPVPASAEAGVPDVSITGSGWGHGVGLSQYGAKALGVDGANYQQILYRYFPGTHLATVGNATVGTFLVDDLKPLWVGLQQQSENLTFTPVGG